MWLKHNIVQTMEIQMPICKRVVRTGNLQAVLWRRYTCNSISGKYKKGVEM